MQDENLVGSESLISSKSTKDLKTLKVVVNTRAL
jgi:hypothetical protein